METKKLEEKAKSIITAVKEMMDEMPEGIEIMTKGKNNLDESNINQEFQIKVSRESFFLVIGERPKYF